MSDETKTDDTTVDNPEGEGSESLYDVVSGAIDEHTIKPAGEGEGEGDAGEGDAGEGDAGEGDAGEGDAGEGEGAASEGEGDAREGEGEGDAGEGEGDAGEGEGEGAGDGEGKDGEGKDGEGDGSKKADSDPLNDPIPESTNEKTAARIKSLIGLVKEKQSHEDQRDAIVDEIQATGADPDQYAATLGFLKLYNSESKEDRQKALAVVQGMVRELAIDLGEGASVTDLSQHDDLQAEVEAGTLTEQRAREIAATREQEKLRESRASARQDKESRASQTAQLVKQGQQQLDTLEEALAVDESYKALRPTFIKFLRPVLKRTHPTEWGAAARDVYEQVKGLPAASATSTPKPKPKHQPMRPKGSSGGDGVEAEAGSAVEAIDDALANL